MDINFPLILLHESEAYDASCFSYLTVGEQICGVLAAFLNSVSSTSIPCMNTADYLFISWGL